MSPIKQTILHDPDNGKHGNCLSAVLASLLHKPIEEVPLFIDPDTWVKDLNTWLRQFGLAYFMVDDFDCHVAAYGIAGLWHEISGNTNRSKEVIHACVAKDSSVVFDPHPDDTGLTKITSSGVFMVLEPWKYSEQADEIAALRQQLEEACYATELLAVVHRDGGHYKVNHGIRKATDDAIAIVLVGRARLE